MTRFPTQAKSPGGIIYWLAPITWPSDCRSVRYPDQRELLEKTCTHGKFIHTADDCWVARIDDNKTMVLLSAADSGMIKKTLLLTAKMLGNFILWKNKKNSLAPHMKFLPEPYIDMSLKTSHICCLFCIELCQIVCDPREICFMLLRSRSRTLHIFSCWLLH